MKFIFGIHINIDVFYKFILSFWMYIVSHAQSTKNKTFAYLCNISRKTWGMKLIFWRWFFLILQIDTKFFRKLIISLWVCIARHFQSTQITSVQYLCNISCKICRVNSILCLANLKSLFKLIPSLLVCVWPGMSNLPKITSSLFLCNIIIK